jgi:hypothetical protein
MTDALCNSQQKCCGPNTCINLDRHCCNGEGDTPPGTSCRNSERCCDYGMWSPCCPDYFHGVNSIIYSGCLIGKSEQSELNPDQLEMHASVSLYLLFLMFIPLMLVQGLLHAGS